MSINFQELRDLLQAISQTDITELTLKNSDFELVVKKQTGQSIVSIPQATVAPPTAVETTNIPGAIASQFVATPEVASTTPIADDKKWVDITSPMVGTFYSAPAPDEDPFAAVGDRINKGDTVCIIEAMKLMNEIEGEVSGQVMEISVQSGEPVEFGQVLMRVNPEG